FSTSLFQQRLLATSSILVCSSFKSFSVLCHPFQYFFQLIGGPDRIQYPPGRRTRSTSFRKTPSYSAHGMRQREQWDMSKALEGKGSLLVARIPMSAGTPRSRAN
ncbi:hypothetical protein V8G54_030094, partial [Vigna mungo]